jgi:hypothetical protein
MISVELKSLLFRLFERIGMNGLDGASTGISASGTVGWCD